MGVALTGYIKELQKRAKDSRVHREFQLVGLEIADILGDRAHKTLYIKMAKKHPRPQELLALAKEVAGNRNVKKRGAYFMAIATGSVKPKKEIFRYKPEKKSRKKRSSVIPANAGIQRK